MKKIYIPQGGGRDFWLRIPMNNESAGRHLCMDDVDENDMHVWLESGYGGCWTLVWEKDGAQRDGIAAKVPASFLGYGTYSVVMAGKFVNGDSFRTKRQLFIRLVDREDQADAEPTMYNEEQAYWAGPAVLSEMLSRDGLNTYELWILQGNEGSLEDYLSVSGLTLNDFMVQWNHLSVDVQSKIDRAEQTAINPKGDYDEEVEYHANDLVYDSETLSSYVSLLSHNTGNPVTDTTYWMKVLDGDDINQIKQDAEDEIDDALQDARTATTNAVSATTAAEAVVAQKVADAQIGYYECNTLAGTATKATTTNSIGQSTFAVPVKGCIVKIKMANANTATDTVYLQFGSDANNTKKELKYNGLAVDASNSWEDGETISVFYDGTYYQASNAQGGGGKAEKIKYDNSHSGLAAENVQGGIDILSDDLVYEGTNRSKGTTKGWYINNSNILAVKDNVNTYRCYTSEVTPGQRFVIKANADNNAFYAFLTELPSNPQNGDQPSFVEGYEQKYAIPAGEEGKFTVPESEGTIYLYIQRDNSNNTFTPEYIRELIPVKDRIDNDIYSKSAVELATVEGITIATATSTEITEDSSSVVSYQEVTEGEIIEVTASNSEIKKLMVAFTTEVPAVGVTISNVIDLRSTEHDEYIKAPINGYVVIAKSANYYTDLKVTKIEGELAGIVTEERIALKDVDKKVNGYVPFMATASTIRQLLAGNSLKWTNEQTSSSSQKYTSRIEPISQYAGKVLVITMKAGLNTGSVALLTDNDHTPGEFGHFSRPSDRFIKLSADFKSVKLLLTEEDKYLYYQVLNTAGTSDLSPLFRIEEESKEVFDTVENYNLTLDRTDYNLNIKDEETNPDGIELLDLCITSENSTWSTGTVNAKGFFLDISDHKGGYLFVTNMSDNCYLAFLRDSNNSDVQGALPSYAAGSGRESVATGTRMRFSIPTDANLVFFGYQNSSQNPQYPAGVFAIGKDIGGNTEVGKTLDIGQVMLQKKALQYLNLKWTAKANISTWSESNSNPYVEAGEQSGMLYSSVQEYDRCVGHDVSLKTFMTAANNPYSLLYTEDCQRGTTDPDYNRSYHAIGGGTTHGYFGTVCSRFACFANGMDEWSTGHFAWLCEQGYLTKIKDQSAQGVEVGDFVWIPGHVQIVTNYVKSGGIVTSVTITEASQPLVILTNKTAAQFNAYLADNNGYVYRNNEIYKNTVYEPSEFVAIDDEVPQEYQYNNDICTYAGDYAAFRMKQENDSRNDYEVWLNYNLGDTPSRSWTGIKLYREVYNAETNAMSLTLVATYSNVDFTKHKYLIPSTDLTVAGKYQAWLYAGNEKSDPTYFEIIDTNVSYTRNGDVITVNFSSSNGTPTKIIVETLGGSHRAVRHLSEAERMDGVVSFNPKAWSADQTLKEYDESNAYIKVFFNGEYGRVTNAPLKIDYNS